MKRQSDGYWISDDRNDVDVDVAHGFLSTAYWCHGIPRETVERSFDNSLCFSIFRDRAMVGFGRVVTDYATFGYLADVFVLEPHRGRGLAAWLVRTILGHPDLQGFRRWSLTTRDAHRVYAKSGFRALRNPDIYMEIHEPGIYSQDGAPTLRR